jgi:hypothetical protein
LFLVKIFLPRSVQNILTVLCTHKSQN